MWKNRSVFLSACVGGAIGFGNIWRFPSLIYHYGGIFLIPYLLALVVIGLPLVMSEIALGQYLQRSELSVAHYLNKHTKGVGVGCVLSGLMVSMYYIPLVSWCVRAFVESFGSSMQNALSMEDNENDDDDNDNGGNGDNGGSYGSVSDMTQYLYHNVIGQYTLDEDQKPQQLVVLNIVYLAVTWTLVGGYCLTFVGGTKLGSGRPRLSYLISLALPILMLFILLCRVVTLPGAGNGIRKYFGGEWDFSVLTNQPDIWSIAVSQIFFSIGIAFGVMTAFGSHCEKNAPVVENSFFIALANSGFTIVNCVCTVAIVGYVTSIEGDYRVYAGPSLLFGVFPAALSTIPGGIHWVRFFFLNVILLGLCSSFVLIEGVTTMILDSPSFNSNNKSDRRNIGYSVSKQRVAVLVVCLVGFAGGLLYTAVDTGLLFMDTVDFYLNYVVLFLGFCKALSVGWISGMKKQVEALGNRWNIVYMYFGTTFGSFLFASLVWFGVKGDTFWLGFISLIVIYGSGMGYCLSNLMTLVDDDTSVSMKSLRNELLMGNVLELRSDLKSSSIDGYMYIPWIWAFLMKHFIPQVLLILFFNLFFAQTDYGTISFGNYNGYETWPYQFVGVSAALLVFGMVFLGVLTSKIYDFLIDPTTVVLTKSGTWVGENNNNDEDFVEMKDTTSNNNSDSSSSPNQGESNVNYTNMENVEKQLEDSNDTTSKKAIDAVMA